MNVRVKISSDSITEQEVSAIWPGTFQDRIERDRIYHLREISGEFTLKGNDFALINELTDECEVITVVVEYYCEGVWTEFYTGTFTKFDCSFDFYTCALRAKIKADTVYQCIFDGWAQDENIYDGTGSAIVVRAFYGSYEAGLECCTECRGAPTGLPVCTFADACEESTTETQNTDNCNPGEYFAVTCFHRITAVSASGPPPYGTGWTLLSGTTYWRCPGDDDVFDIGVLQHGRRFDAVLEKLVSELGCSLTVRSHFFGINATHAAPPSNDAYDYATDYYQDLTVHQKSDVKRPDGDPSFSFIWKMKLKELLDDLQTMFNVFWRLDGTDLILEHISYFEAGAGADYSTKVMPLQLDYELDAPKRELFFWSDDEGTPEFVGVPIVYNCGRDDKERRVRLFSTDVEFIRNEAYQDRISDDKWVLLSNTVEGSTYFVNERNTPLGWVALHDKLHRHYRHFSVGTLNGVAVTFDSVIPNRKQPEFRIGLCCGDVADFDPSNYITTPLGQGRVQSADIDLKNDNIKLQLNY